MSKDKNSASRPWKDYLLEELKNPKAAQDYLEVAVEEYEADGGRPAFLLALRTVAEAQGGISELARKRYVRKASHVTNSPKGISSSYGTCDGTGKMYTTHHCTG